MYPKELKKLFRQNLYTNIHISIIHNSQKEATTYMSINGWMDKQKVIYPYAMEY